MMPSISPIVMDAKTVGLTAEVQLTALFNTKGAAHVMQHQGYSTCHEWQDHLFNNGGAVYHRGVDDATTAGQYSSTSLISRAFPCPRD